MTCLQSLCLLGLTLTSFVSAELNPTFYKFIVSKYGKKIADSINRKDRGPDASFGGGNISEGTALKHYPVVFVHGYTSSARDFKSVSVPFLSSKGYTAAEMYATSYGTSASPTGQTGMACEYIKQNYYLIKSVAEYTRSKVAVLGMSMGGPISRKAILGGKCIETGEYLGPPLTDLIRTYISVCGVQHGTDTCNSHSVGVCNRVFGMKCGSKFYKDMNGPQNYEGERKFVIESRGDEVVPINSCNTRTMEFPGSRNFLYSSLSHVQTYTDTQQLQYELLAELRN